MLFNQSRANDVLAREGLDGLIAATPINQYYLTDYWGLFNSAGGYDGSYFGLYTPKHSALILPALEIRTLESNNGSWMDEVYSYFTEGEGSFEDGTPQGAEYKGWQPADEANLTALEERWMSRVAQLGPNCSPDAFWALTRATKAAGVTKGRVAVDDHRIQGWLAICGIDDITCVYRPDLFNEIRMVKTPDELQLMKTAALINENSLIAAANSMRVGQTWDEIESVYMTEMARQGGKGCYLLCGLGGLPAGEVRPNEPIFMDALGHFKRYHGDFGRCVVVGEPTDKQLAYHAGILAGWEAAQELVKPGISYTDLSQTVGEIVRKSGITTYRNPIVHGVGLEHTDDPKPYGVMPQTKPSQVLQESMVINIDFPHTEIGWGSVHMEDTVVITKDGFERLSKSDLSILVKN